MKQKPSNPAKISLKNIKSFFQGYARKFSDAFGMLPKYKQEQVIWRTERAKACMENGSCLYCGCDTPGKFYSDDACEDPERKCYPDMMAEQEWEVYKRDNNIEIKID